jgi:hypothetical protein
VCLFGCPWLFHLDLVILLLYLTISPLAFFEAKYFRVQHLKLKNRLDLIWLTVEYYFVVCQFYHSLSDPEKL